MIILIDIEIPKDLYDGKNISCIYCVTNKLNNKNILVKLQTIERELVHTDLLM